ncbi:hypothetical protein MMYC01_204751 [Madurella mycetomatis]|uniref:Uncharacterized protein n=1 Tax=Madurella mycetomatis TaxID=100816 RepID=A0A175W5G5_9PEZI|nr:hypothetical protein MMYC01_204751 [Madurella mycetomatis]
MFFPFRLSLAGTQPSPDTTRDSITVNMASSLVSVVYTMPLVSNKRGQVTIGTDLIVTYHSGMAYPPLSMTSIRVFSALETKKARALLWHSPYSTLKREGPPWRRIWGGNGSVALALPRDGGLTPYVPSPLSRAGFRCLHSKALSLDSSVVAMKPFPSRALQHMHPSPVISI